MIAPLDFLGAPDDARARLVPDDRVSAPKNRQRAQALEPGGTRVQAALRVVTPMDHRRAEVAVNADQTRTNRSEAAPQIELLELQPKQLISSHAPIHRRACGMTKRMSALGAMTSTQRQSGRPSRKC